MTKEENTLNASSEGVFSTPSSPTCFPEEASDCREQLGFGDGDATCLQKVFSLPVLLLFVLQASLPSHAAPSPFLFSGSLAHKSRDQRHGLNLSFLPSIDKGLFVLLQGANFYCSVKTYTMTISSLYTALQVWP